MSGISWLGAVLQVTMSGINVLPLVVKYGSYPDSFLSERKRLP
jgi:hypothetical protein